MWASARRHPAMMQLLISKGADVNARSTDRNYQRHVTAEGRPKSLDSGGLTPLLYAARENCMACVEVLLKNKADIDLPDPDGVSPLIVAIMNANWDIAKRLITAGADVNQWDIYGEAPLFTAIGLRTRTEGGRGVHRSAEHDHRHRDHQAAARPRRQPQHAAVLQAGERDRRDQHARLHAAHPRGQRRRRRDGQAAAREGRRRHALHGGPADANPCRDRRPLFGKAGDGTDRPPPQGRHGRQRRRPDQPRRGGSRRDRRCTLPCASGRRR